MIDPQEMTDLTDHPVNLAMVDLCGMVLVMHHPEMDHLDLWMDRLMMDHLENERDFQEIGPGIG